MCNGSRRQISSKYARRALEIRKAREEDFALVVRNGSEEERIPLGNIMNVSASTNTNPPRITLRLVRPGRFGADVSFSPSSRISFNPFAKNPVAEDLIVRVDKARLGRAAAYPQR